MENTKYRVCYGNFEIRRSQIPRNCDDHELKQIAYRNAETDNYSVFAEFDSMDSAVDELHKHKSDIRKAQFYANGSGYCGTVWWAEEYTDDGTLDVVYAEWE
jgi:hypothetical protein